MDRIKLAVRVRPLVCKEKRSREYWQVTGNEIYQIGSGGVTTGEKFAFDNVFGKETSNPEIFEQIVKPFVNRAVGGSNVTVIAYGETSSGKTYTMLGSSGELGICQLTASYLFNCMKNSEGQEFLVRASYLEIHDEKVHDLLEQSNRNLKICQEDGIIRVSDLKQELVTEPAEVMNLLKMGQKIRRLGETKMNKSSSRSHTIFRLIIESRLSDSGHDEPVKVSQLNLVDLAGSGHIGVAGTSGDSFKERSAINLSLFHLRQVISQLSERSQFVNFRDSKLTYILQPSFGGNAHTLIICTVTPTSVDFTLKTLRFASKAKTVKNNPQVNEVMSDGTLIKKYACELQRLQKELKAAEEQISSFELGTLESKLEEQKRLNSELQKRINTLQKTLIRAECTAKPHPNRRRSLGGQMDLMNSRQTCLPTSVPIPEIMKTSLDLTNDADLNTTPLEDFEVHLIDDEREKCSKYSFSPVSPQYSSCRSFECSTSSDTVSMFSSSRKSPFSKSFKSNAGVQTSPEIGDTSYKELKVQVPSPIFRSQVAYWEKEYREQDVQKSLDEKEKGLLKPTLSVQENLIVKLSESTVERATKDIDCSHSYKIEKPENLNRESNEISGFRDNVWQEMTNLKADRDKEISEQRRKCCHCNII